MACTWWRLRRTVERAAFRKASLVVVSRVPIGTTSSHNSSVSAKAFAPSIAIATWKVLEAWLASARRCAVATRHRPLCELCRGGGLDEWAGTHPCGGAQHFGVHVSLLAEARPAG